MAPDSVEGSMGVHWLVAAKSRCAARARPIRPAAALRRILGAVLLSAILMRCLVADPPRLYFELLEPRLEPGESSVCHSFLRLRVLADHERDGLCGAPCAQRGTAGICRPSLVFTADRCE